MKVFNFRLFPYLLITLAAGIVTAAFDKLAVDIIVIAIVSVLALLSYKTRYFKIVLTGAITLTAGIVITALTLFINKPAVFNDVEISGRVTGDIYVSDTYTFITLDDLSVEGKPVRGKADLILVNEELLNIIPETGDILTFKGDLRKLSINPYNSKDVRAYYNRIYYNAEFDYIVNRAQGKIKLNEKIGYYIRRIIDDNISDKDVGDMAYSLITGDKVIDSELYESISVSGLAHVFVVSGLHVSILAAFVYYLLKLCKANKLLSLLLTVAVLLFYSYICGFPPSVIRAVIMCALVLLGRHLGLRNDTLSIVSFSAFITLLVSPLSLMHISFQMSYASVLGIILLYKPLGRLTPEFPLKSVLVTTISANIALLPVFTFYFNSLSLYFVFANLIVLPFIAFIYIVLISGIVLAAALPVLGIIIKISGFMLTAIKMLTGFIVSLPYSEIVIGSIGIFAIFYYMCIIITSDYLLLNRRISVRLYALFSLLSLTGIILALY